MSIIPSRRSRSIAAMFAIFAAAVLQTRHARADDLLGLYVGGAVGQSLVDVSVPTVGDFRENHTAFKVIAGIRPILLIGAELSYIDFGHPSENLNSVPTDVSEKGADAFGVLYLPVPVVDVFVKAGLARLQSTTNSALRIACSINFSTCAPLFRLDRTNTSFAAGAGAQFKFGSWAVRAEYERFNAAGGNPSLLSIGLTWTFL